MTSINVGKVVVDERQFHGAGAAAFVTQVEFWSLLRESLVVNSPFPSWGKGGGEKCLRQIEYLKYLLQGSRSRAAQSSIAAEDLERQGFVGQIESLLCSRSHCTRTLPFRVPFLAVLLLRSPSLVRVLARWPTKTRMRPRHEGVGVCKSRRSSTRGLPAPLEAEAFIELLLCDARWDWGGGGTSRRARGGSTAVVILGHAIGPLFRAVHFRASYLCWPGRLAAVERLLIYYELQDLECLYLRAGRRFAVKGGYWLARQTKGVCFGRSR